MTMDNLENPPTEAITSDETSVSGHVIALCFSIVSLIGILAIVPGVQLFAGLTLMADVRPTNTRPQEMLDTARLILYAFSAIYITGIFAFLLLGLRSTQSSFSHNKGTLQLWARLLGIISTSCIFVLILLKINGQPPFPGVQTLQLFAPSSLSGIDIALFASYFFIIISGVLLFTSKASLRR